MLEKRSQQLTGKGKRYSEAFKRKVVDDVESGLYSANQAQKVYKIGGNNTIYKWVARYGLKGSIVSKGGKMKKPINDQSLDLHSRIRYLEKVISDLSIEKKILETTIDIANETYGLDLKKNTGKALLSASIEKVMTRSRSRQ